jgi:Ca-activated chloride channel family protein
MVASGATVYAVTPPGGFGTEAQNAESAPPDGSATDGATSPAERANTALFVDEKTVRVEARLGHAEMPKQGGESFVMVELKGSDVAAPQTNAAVHLGLVIDRSGSMRGKRFENAKSSAIAAIDRLVDGDTVSLVTFDTKTETVVPPTKVDASSRASLRRSVESIVLGGDTCISCGIEAMAGIMAQTPTLTRRMIVLSDGDATAGVRDVDEMRSLARRARLDGVTVSGIGVDLQYNERMMAAVAEGGEGQHRFVAEPTDLVPVFEAEAASLRQTVAENVEARLRLEPGVELVEVLDRPFTRSGSDLVVQLGSITKGEVKTVLCRVRVPGTEAADLPVANVSVRFRDLTSADPAAFVESTGPLGAKPALKLSDPDPFVLARVERTETARTLDEANRLFRAGKVDAARARIDARRDALKKKGGVFLPAPKPTAGSRTGEAKRDVDKQLGILDRASSGFATPPPAEPMPVAPGQGAAPAMKRPAPAKPKMADPFESNARQNQEDAFNSTR